MERKLRAFVDTNLFVFRKAIITKDIYKTDKITEDPSDNKFLACALEAKADFIVSRDKHIMNLKHYRYMYPLYFL